MTAYTKPSISVIVPVHRWPDLIVDSVGKMHYFLSNNFDDFELILLDSGIGDSPAICDEMARIHDRTRVIHDSIHTQFGAKLKMGYRVATKDLVWLITLDLPFPLEYSLKAIPFFQKYDCVFSYRVGDARGPWRRLQTFVYNVLTNVVLGLKVRNVNSQFRIFKREVIQQLEPLSDGWFIDAEVLYYITKLHIPYAEIPIPLLEHENSKSSVSVFAFLGILKEMAHFFRYKKI